MIDFSPVLRALVQAKREARDFMQEHFEERFREGWDECIATMELYVREKITGDDLCKKIWEWEDRRDFAYSFIVNRGVSGRTGDSFVMAIALYNKTDYVWDKNLIGDEELKKAVCNLLEVIKTVDVQTYLSKLQEAQNMDPSQWFIDAVESYCVMAGLPESKRQDVLYQKELKRVRSLYLLTLYHENSIVHIHHAIKRGLNSGILIEDIARTYDRMVIISMQDSRDVIAEYLHFLESFGHSYSSFFESRLKDLRQMREEKKQNPFAPFSVLYAGNGPLPREYAYASLELLFLRCIQCELECPYAYEKKEDVMQDEGMFLQKVKESFEIDSLKQLAFSTEAFLYLPPRLTSSLFERLIELTKDEPNIASRYSAFIAHLGSRP